MKESSPTPANRIPAAQPSPAEPAAAARLAGHLALGQDGHERGAAVPKVATGIGGFDHVTMGGLPQRRTTVIAGPAGAAKTLFAAQFLAEGVRLGQPGVFVTLEEPAADLRSNFATLGWDLPAWEAAGDWRFVDGSPLTPASGEQRPVFDVDTLAAQIGTAVDRTGAQRLALDSLSAVLSLHDDVAQARQLLRTLVLRLRAMSLTVVITVETGEDSAGPLSAYGVEEFVADNVVLLRNLQEGPFRRRTVEVLKMRGAMHHKGAVPFTVIPGEGVRVLPITEPPAGAVDITRLARVATGVAGLDDMTSGGLLTGSNAVIAGPTGTGKTMLATAFAAHGASRGEVVLLMAFEESQDQVRRNMTALGHDSAAYERAGLLHVVSLYPEVASLDDHLVELRELVARVRPARLVLDGLSALERLGSPRSFAGYLIGVTGIARGTGISSLVTAAPSASGELTTANSITGLAEVIIMLRHHEAAGSVHRGIHVQRMRGSSHDCTIRELVIDETGVAVAGPLTADTSEPPLNRC